MNDETLSIVSNIGLILSIIPVTIHGIETFLPMQARWIVNWVLPFFGLMLPNQEKFWFFRILRGEHKFCSRYGAFASSNGFCDSPERTQYAPKNVVHRGSK